MPLLYKSFLSNQWQHSSPLPSSRTALGRKRWNNGTLYNTGAFHFIHLPSHCTRSCKVGNYIGQEQFWSIHWHSYSNKFESWRNECDHYVFELWPGRFKAVLNNIIYILFIQCYFTVFIFLEIWIRPKMWNYNFRWNRFYYFGWKNLLTRVNLKLNSKK